MLQITFNNINYLPRCITSMCQGHIADAELVIASQNTQGIADRVAAFDTDKRRYLTRPGAVGLKYTCFKHFGNRYNTCVIKQKNKLILLLK